MAISINWPTGVISVPKADTFLFGTDPGTGREIRTFDTEKFHKDLRSLEESQAGRGGFPITHNYDSETIIDGVSYAAKFIINSQYYQVEFEDGTYRVVFQNTNNNIATVAVVNQVSVQPGNAAGLIGSEQIRSLIFTNDQIHVDTKGGGVSGIGWPIGGADLPVDNYADAHSIAVARNYHKFTLRGAIALDPTDVVKESHFYGDSPVGSIIVFDSNNAAEFVAERCAITGTMAFLATDLRCSIIECAIGAVTDFYGIAKDCALNGDITLFNGSTTDEEVAFIDCVSFVAGGEPTINVNGMPSAVKFRRYSGGLILTNCTDAGCNISVDGDCRLEIAASCTAGTIVIGPGVDVTADNSGAGCTVIYNTNLADKVEQAATQSRVAADQSTEANQKL